MMLGELRRAFGDEVFQACIPYDTAVPTSIRERVPLRRLKWRSRAVVQVSKLAEEVLEKTGM